ncbi:MAG: hypothetical protein CMC01_00320 [Flavobacteriaceae bacterium]|nr:hypothetical protein [Flavobacteriaceae bacterium]
MYFGLVTKTMSKQNKYIGILEKILIHLKNSKLEYFKASDHALSSEKKRFFNQQALIRNRFFQDVLGELQRLGMSSDDIIISQFNFDQLLISTIDTLKSTAIEKCLRADQALLKIYSVLKKFEKSNLDFDKHIERLEVSVSQNEEWISSLTEKKINSF